MANPAQNNLYLGLYRYAPQQNENFTTEALVHLLRHLNLAEPNLASALLHSVTRNRLMLTPEECSNLRVTTQKAFMEGRPDILLFDSKHFVIIEAKVESEPGWNQLERYKKILANQSEPHKLLIFLTRYPADAADEKKVDHCLQWHQLVRIVEKVCAKSENPVTIYLVDQFVEFFRERGIAMDKVSWELGRGMQSLLSLMDMLDEAVIATDLKSKPRTAGVEFNGRYLYVGEIICWVGVYYSSPHLIRFEAHDITKTQAENPTVGRPEKSSKGKFKWIDELDLESEAVHFFALAPESQQSRVHDFVSQSVAAVKGMS